MKSIKEISLTYIARVLFSITSIALADNHWADDWKISIDGKTTNAGSLTFTLTFKPGEDGMARDPVVVTAPIPEDSNENDVADMIANAFRAILGDEDFDIDVAWGENIKIETNGDTPDFVLELTNNPLQGISLEIQE